MSTLMSLIVLFGVSAFNLPVMNGKVGEVFDSAKYPNDVLVVEAYFKDCPYCNQNAPNVDSLADVFKTNPRVHVLDVGIDTKDVDYANWIGRHHPNHPVLKDSQRKLIKQLGTTSYPSIYILDGTGTIRYRNSGTWDSATRMEIQEKVEDLLK